MDLKTTKFLDSLQVGKWASNALPHKLFLYGPPKSGKTSLALSSGTNTLHILTEPSANVLRNDRMAKYRDYVSTIEFTSLDELLKIAIGIKEQHSSVKDFQNIVIDTLDGISNNFMSDLSTKARDARQDYKLLMEGWIPIISNLAKAPVNLTIISHLREKTDVSGAILGTSGNVSNGVRMETVGKLDSCGMMKVQNGKHKISFKGSSMIEAGSRTDLNGLEIEAEKYWEEIRKWEGIK